MIKSYSDDRPESYRMPIVKQEGIYKCNPTIEYRLSLCKTQIYIISVYVPNGMRCLGYGNTLIVKVIDIAKATRTVKDVLLTPWPTDNKTSMSVLLVMYRRLGFITSSEDNGTMQLIIR